jgi:hypothetical protein
MPDDPIDLDDEAEGVSLLVECDCGNLFAWRVDDATPPTRCAICRTPEADD